MLSSRWDRILLLNQRVLKGSNVDASISQLPPSHCKLFLNQICPTESVHILFLEVQISKRGLDTWMEPSIFQHSE